MSEVYRPTRNAGVASTPSDRRRAGFASNMRPLFGKQLADVSDTTSDVRQIVEESRKYKHFEVTADTVNQGNTATSVWKWDGFSLRLPDTLDIVIQTAQDILDTLVGFLEGIRDILQALSVLLLSLDDLLGAIINALLDELEAFLAGLITGTGLYFLAVPPVVKAETSEEASADKEILARLVSRFLDTSDDPNSRSTLISNFLLESPGKVVRGGNAGFYDTVMASIHDVQDPNRPQFGNEAWIAGMVVIAGFPDVTLALGTWEKLKALFGEFFGDNPEIYPSKPQGFTAEFAGNGLSGPTVALSWDPHRVLLNTIDPKATKAYWRATKESIYRIVDPSSIPAKDRVKYATENQWFLTANLALDSASGELSKLAERSIYDDSTIIGRRLGFGPLLASSSSSLFIDGAAASINAVGRWEVYDAVGALKPGTNYRYLFAREFERVSGKDTNGNDVIEATKTVVFANSRLVKLPAADNQGIVSPGGVAPNWRSASIGDLFPFLKGILVEFTNLIDQLRNIISSSSDYLQAQINALIKDIEKWQKFLDTINAYLEALKRVFDLNFGAYILNFAGKGGNSFFENMLSEGLLTPPSGALTQAANALRQSEETTSRDLFSASGWKARGEDLRDNFTAEQMISSGSPNFFNDEITTGFVILAGSEVPSAVMNVYKILNLFFGDGSEQKTTGARVNEVLGPGLEPGVTPRYFSDDFRSNSLTEELATVQTNTAFSGFDVAIEPVENVEDNVDCEED